MDKTDDETENCGLSGGHTFDSQGTRLLCCPERISLAHTAVSSASVTHSYCWQMRKHLFTNPMTIIMERRALLSALGALGLSGLAGCADSIPGTEPSTTENQTNANREYPDGAGPNQINFSKLDSDDDTVLHTPGAYWDSYAILYREPSDRRRIEGDYYISSSTGEVISDLWYGAKDYRNGDTYAYVQPADQIPDDHQREKFESDPAYVYDNGTDAYYRYDRHYGQAAPTNIGRHTDILTYYNWEATGTTAHHGVPVITYQLSDTESVESGAPPAITGSLKLGVEEGVIYAFNITLDDEGKARYTYTVRPATFPDHRWVNTARTVADSNSSINESR